MNGCILRPDFSCIGLGRIGRGAWRRFQTASSQTLGDPGTADPGQSALNPQPEGVAGLPAAELTMILSAASAAERAELLAALAAGEVATLLAVLVQSGAAPALVADVLASAVLLDPGAAEGLAVVIMANASPDTMPALAAAMLVKIQQASSDGAVAGSAAMAGLVQATLSMDDGQDMVAAIVALGQNATGEGGSAAIAQALANIADTTSNAALRSRIVTQVAVAGGAFSSAFSQQRSDPVVGDITLGPQPGADAPVADDVPVPPPAIGGVGATSAQIPASQAGQRNLPLQTALSNAGGTGLSVGDAAAGGGLSAGAPPPPISPTN